MKKIIFLIILSLATSCSKHHETSFDIDRLCTSSTHICSLKVSANDETFLDELLVNQKINSIKLNIKKSNLQWYVETGGNFVNNHILEQNNLPVCSDQTCSKFLNPTGYDFPDNRNSFKIGAEGTITLDNKQYYINIGKTIDIKDIDTPHISAKCNKLTCTFNIDNITKLKDPDKNNLIYLWYENSDTLIGKSYAKNNKGSFVFSFKKNDPKKIHAITKTKNGDVSQKSNTIDIFVKLTPPSVSYQHISLDYTFKVDKEAKGGQTPYTYTWYDSSGKLGIGKQLEYHYTKNIKAETVWAIATDKGGIKSGKSNQMTFDVTKAINAPTISAGIANHI